MTTLEPILRRHPFFAGLSEPDLRIISGCAKNVRFQPSSILAKDGQPADAFFLIRQGRVVVEIPSTQGTSLQLETLDAGEVVGWSWLFPPYRWLFDVKAVTRVRALSMDGRCLREKCDSDPRLGYDLMKRFSRVMVERLSTARLQLLDLYGNQKPGATEGFGT